MVVCCLLHAVGAEEKLSQEQPVSASDCECAVLSFNPSAYTAADRANTITWLGWYRD